jgi:hypothetical protein
MAAYAEGLNVLRHADVGLRQREQDAEDDAAAPTPSCTSTSST